jgi:probable HAF family extracellular repeat protein
MNRIRIASMLIVNLAILSTSLLAQESAARHQPRYRLVDLGTFGGPASYFQNGLDGILSENGTEVGWANTAEPDPFNLFCAAPNCFATHAFRVHRGEVSDLGTLPGGTSSQADWISDNGLIAGFSDTGALNPFVAGFPELRAVLWRHGQIVDLGTLPDNGFGSIANAVNDRGQAVGFALNTVPDPFSFVLSGLPGATQTRAFLWQDGVMQDLGTLGGPDAIAGFVNDRGEIVGPSYTDIDPATGAPGAVHPFLWKNGHMLDLGSLGGTDSEPTALNERGEVVGFSTLAGDSISHPFLWTKGHLIDLGTLGGDAGTTHWINDRGDIVGKADLPGAAPQVHDGVLWRDGKAIDLGVLPGDSCSNAYYVNSRGQVVGTSENRELCSIGVGEHAFLWEKDGPMIDLNTVIAPGADLQLTYAVAINDRGEIAGFAVPPGCVPQDYELCGHAYVLLPCEEYEHCANSRVGNDREVSAPVRPNVTLISEPSRTESATSLDQIGIRMQQRFHLPGRRASPSD